MNKKIYRIGLAALCILHAACASATEVASQCVADLDDLAAFMPVNDAGASVALSDHRAAIDTAYQAARKIAAEAATNEGCETALQNYLHAWRPGHLTLFSNDGFAKLTAPVAKTGDKAAQDAAPDPRAPGFKVLDKDTILFTFGTFDGRYRSAIDTMLKTHRRELASHKHWIIDVRNNNGGSDSTYAPLLPWLLDGEHVDFNMEWLATPANLKAHGEICDLLGDRDNCVKSLAPVIDAMRDAPAGTWVMSKGEPRIEYTRAPAQPRHVPQRVAVLVDRRCGSSCEAFLLQVRSSYRVRLLGRPTHGTLDVSNMRRHSLASGKRILMYTTSRAFRAALMPIDQIGVQPDILLPQPADDAARDAEVGQVRRWLAGGSLRPDH